MSNWHNMPFVLEAAALLTAFARPNHIVVYVHGDSRSCRRAATPITLGIITGVFEAAALLTAFARPNHIVVYVHGDSIIGRLAVSSTTWLFAAITDR